MPSVVPHARVFVVQLGSEADPGHGRLAGRVEHVDSGLGTRFASSDEMIEFFARVLRGLQEPQDDDAGNPARDH